MKFGERRVSSLGTARVYTSRCGILGLGSGLADWIDGEPRNKSEQGRGLSPISGGETLFPFPVNFRFRSCSA